MQLTDRIERAFEDFQPAVAFNLNLDDLRCDVTFVIGGNTEHEWPNVSPAEARQAWNNNADKHRVGYLQCGKRLHGTVAPAAMDAALELFEHLYADGLFTNAE